MSRSKGFGGKWFLTLKVVPCNEIFIDGEIASAKAKLFHSSDAPVSDGYAVIGISFSQTRGQSLHNDVDLGPTGTA